MVYLLFNPKANNGKAESDLKDFPNEFNGQEVTRVNVLEMEDYRGFVEGLSEEDALIIAGGDGTLHHFVNIVYGYDLKCDVYMYGLGTGNDFLNDIGKQGSKEPVLINQYIKNLPVVIIDGKERRFINGIGFGIDGYCCEEGDRQRAKSDKAVNYTAIAIKGILGKYKYRTATITVDGVTKEYKKVVLAPAMMGRFYGGGMMVCPKQDRLNKEHTLTNAIISGISRLHVLVCFPKMFDGTHVKYKKFMSFQEGHEITVEFDIPCALQIDGETVLNVKKYTARYE